MRKDFWRKPSPAVCVCLCLSICVSFCVFFYLCVIDRMSGDLNPAAVPAPGEDSQGDARWISQHEHFVLECKDAEPDVLFMGDSMIQLMQQHEVWKDLFSPLHALNFGLAGDTTCNVLWRLQNGELKNIQPKVVVLWVGTNNHQHTAEQVAGGVRAITQFLITQLPRAKIIVLGLLPRGEHQNPLREKNAAVNEFLRSWVPQLGPAHFLDLSAQFVQPDGTISIHDMFDFLHLTAAGYQTLSKPLNDLLLQIMFNRKLNRRSRIMYELSVGWTCRETNHSHPRHQRSPARRVTSLPPSESVDY